ncbi:MAG: DUF4263 domain-containing protein [Bacteroidia bacterium]|nr:DUF4263 domain-containing protein [Bacteroidia bacterium]
MAKTNQRNKKVLDVPEPKIDVSAYFPPEEYKTNPNYAKAKHIKELIRLIDLKSPEAVIDSYLSEHKELLTFVMARYNTGHHNSWVIPKRVIKTKFRIEEKGLIPDYILGGQSTSGKEWFIVELKGADAKWFVERQGEIYFSDTINKGIHQLIEYLYHCDKYQSKFRDEYRLTDFHAPKAILIAGHRSEFDNNERKKAVKKTWEKLLGNRLEIITYNRLRDQLVSRLNDFKWDRERKKKPDFNPFDR